MLRSCASAACLFTIAGTLLGAVPCAPALHPLAMTTPTLRHYSALAEATQRKLAARNLHYFVRRPSACGREGGAPGLLRTKGNPNKSSCRTTRRRYGGLAAYDEGG